MAINADLYHQQLVALLPIGDCWNSDPDSNLGKLLRAMAEEFGRIDGRADVVIGEAFPSTASELLADWESQAGLPDACQSLATTVSARRANLARKITTEGGQSRDYYIAVAAAIGYTVTISDLMPYEAGHQFNGAEISASEWVFVWRVNAPATTTQVARCGTARCGDPIRKWGNELLECVIASLKPAHTHVLFSYT